MIINYSSNETIEKYTTLFNEFADIEDEYVQLTNNRHLIDFSAGLALTNSIHERFVKSIFSDYAKTHTLSNTKKEKLIKLYKAPQKADSFVILFNLNLEEGFNLYRPDLPEENVITSFENILTIIKEQRGIRNKYMHGDFNFTDSIIYTEFHKNLIDFQKYHVIMLKIIRYSFYNSINELPEDL